MKLRIDLEKEYGIVLEGGGARGAYQIGVWKALREAGMKIKGVAGTSVGALNGALICMDDLGKAEEIWGNMTYSTVFNVDDSELQNEELKQRLAKSVAPAPAIFLNAQFESELTELDEADAREMLEDAGLDESGLDQLARVGFDILGLQTFLTAGEKEVRAWQIHKGWTAPQAAGVIHTDFEKGFIKAEVVSYDDFVEAYGSMAKIKEEGKLRLEGKDYVMQDGDIVEFKFNVSK